MRLNFLAVFLVWCVSGGVHAQENDNRFGVHPNNDYGVDPGNDRTVEPGPIHEIFVDPKEYPEAAQQIEDAKAAGKPEVLTWEPDGASDRRTEATKGVPREKGKDRDEYPPASTREGGKGSSVRHIEPSDNRGAGATYGKQMRDKPSGTRFRFEVQKKKK